MIYKLRTIDVWDTLLRRDCHPECIKLATAMYLLLGWRQELRPEFRDLWNLYRLRLGVERRLAEISCSAGMDDEYEITKVFEIWLDEVLAKTVNQPSPSILVEFELQWEIQRTFVDSEIVNFVQSEKSDQTIFLSDFYMGREKLSRLLEAKGLSQIVPDGISSSDVGMNKRSGKLFNYVHKLYGILPKDHLHIGDNSWSDVECPRQLGINATHYLPTNAHSDRVNREYLFSSRSILIEHISRECAQIAKLNTEKMNEQEARAFRIGADAAPLFIGLATWVAEQAISQQFDQIHFLTREGDFFLKVFSSLCPNNIFFGHKLPEARVLEVSRMATFAPSMKEVSVDEMARVWLLFKVQSVAGLFKTLGLNINDFESVLNELGLCDSDIINNPLEDDSIKKLFNNKFFIESVVNSISSKKGLMKQYFELNGISKNKKVGLVDIGWRGTIQDNIAICFPEVDFHGMYLGLRKFINPQPINAKKEAYAINENYSNEYLHLFENFALLEMLCVSGEGSVTGYGMSGNEPLVLREQCEEERSTFNSFTCHFQAGVIAAAEHWSGYIQRYVIESGEIREVALKIWAKLLSSPSNELTQYFLKTPQNDFFGYGDTFYRNNYPQISSILLSLFDKSRRSSLIDYVRRTQWTEPIKNARDISVIHRMLLVTLFKLAHFVKLSRMRAKRFM